MRNIRKEWRGERENIRKKVRETKDTKKRRK
jgi:hypothetical protein